MFLLAAATVLACFGCTNASDLPKLPEGFDLSPGTGLLTKESPFESDNRLGSSGRDPLSPLAALFPSMGAFRVFGETDDGKWTQKDTKDKITIVGELPEGQNPKNILVKAEGNVSVALT